MAAFSIVDGDLKMVKKELLGAVQACRDRGLWHSAKWSADLAFCLNPLTISDDLPASLSFTSEDVEDLDAYNVAKSYFDLKEYDRAAHTVKDCQSPKASFLHYYARYLSQEMKKEHVHLDTLGPLVKGQLTNEALRLLRVGLSKKHQKKELDGYCLYVYGVVLRKLDLHQEAIDVLAEAAQYTPLHWGVWLELAALITDRDMMKTLTLPNHWMKQFFLAHVYTELQMTGEALQKYHALQEAGFGKSTYITARIAVAHHNIRDIDTALALFTDLTKKDPYRIENMDHLSNLLYVKNMQMELCYLAHKLCEIDKYRVETCFVIGNYYSLCTQHEKAVVYFQRALKLNPRCLSAWTLMGHEYMEMKNTAAAIQAYRRAIEVNRRDYRAWYGLAQSYEILKMPFYCIYYYRQAHQLRPNDSRMLVALGDCYHKLEKLAEAKKCYWKAYSVGDMEKVALVNLAKLYERLNESDLAAQCYHRYIHDMCEAGEILEHEELSSAFRNLAHYYYRIQRWDDAAVCARRCCDYNSTREEGKALLRQISQLRAEVGPAATPAVTPAATPAATPAIDVGGTGTYSDMDISGNSGTLIFPSLRTPHSTP